MEIKTAERAGHPRDEIARRRARERAEWERLIVIAEKRLGSFGGPSSATLPPPPQPETR